MTAEEVGIGTVLLGRFEVTGLLGRGGSGTVHRADDLLLHRQVALKVIPRDPAGGPRTDEVRLLSALHHPNLVRLHEVFDAAGRTVLVLDLVEGRTLAEVAADGPVDTGAAGHLAAGLADALHYIHSRGVVHRDVTPTNVLVLEGGRDAKLADFGIAGRVEVADRPIGTARYLSPEQARGGVVGPASDIYSLGLTLAAALGGAPVPAGVVGRVHYEPPLPRGLPYGWRSLLGAMTARAPEERPSAAVVRTRALSLATSAPSSPSTAEMQVEATGPVAPMRSPTT